MPATTYHCRACNATWKADGEPHGCPSCGSRVIDRAGRSDAMFDNPYDAPMARQSGQDSLMVSSASFTVAFWLGCIGLILGSIAVGVVGGPDNPKAAAGGALVLVSLVSLIAALIGGLVKLYRAWDLIQPLRRLDRAESDMPTPGSAVGLLFVPFYNLYWSFVAWHGLAIRANKYMLVNGVQARPMNQGLAMTYCIMATLSCIPCVNYLTGLPTAIIYYIFILDIDRVRNAILGAAGKPERLDFDDL